METFYRSRLGENIVEEYIGPKHYRGVDLVKTL